MTPARATYRRGAGGFVGGTPPGCRSAARARRPAAWSAARRRAAPGAGGVRRRRPGSRLRRDQLRRPGQADVGLRADVDDADVLLRELVIAHDVRRDQHHDVGVGVVDVVAREELPEPGNAGDSPVTPLPVVRVVLLDQPGEQVGFPFAQAQERVHLARRERQRRLAADVDAARRWRCSRRERSSTISPS